MPNAAMTRRNRAPGAAADLEVDRPHGGPVLWVRLPHGSDAHRFAQVALRHGVSVLPGARTSPDGAYADHLRISFGAEPDRLRAAVDRLSAARTAYRSTGEGGPVSLEVVV
jgi:DNA-binding transcriptional MocR family regulator